MVNFLLFSLFVIGNLGYMSSIGVVRISGSEYVVSGFVGDTVVIPCQVDLLNCGELFLITWSKIVNNGLRSEFVYSDGVSSAMEDFANPDRAFLQNNNLGFLKLHSLAVQDEGKYMCDVTYINGQCPSLFYTRLYPLNFIDVDPPQERTVIKDSSRRWPYNFVAYILDSSFSNSEREAIQSAADEIKENTCVEWIELQRGASSDYVSIKKSSECKTQEGRTGGVQILSLSSSCCMERGIILHLLLHTLGIRHEHQRPDRDSYITVNWGNIIDDHKHLFTKYRPSTADSLGLDYNYRSVMHFPSSLYAKNKSIPVLSPKHCDVTSVELGDGFTQGYLTKLDIYNINNLYGCYRN